MRSAADAKRVLAEAIEGSSLIERGSRGLVMLSGGADSTALLAGIVAWQPEAKPVALHLNYGLRAEAGADAAVAGETCERLGVELVTIQAGPSGPGNVQAWARELRYRAAEDLCRERGLGWVAVGHTMSDVAETVLYRLASSPGRRALTSMRPRKGRIVRPLLSLTRAEARELTVATGLPFADDATNEDPAYARAKIRSEVLPPLTEVNEAAVPNIALTRAELIEEGDLLDQLAGELLARAESGGRVEGAVLKQAHPALARLAIRRLAERELGRQVPLSLATAAAIRGLQGRPEGGSIDLGGGASAVVESGAISIQGSGPPPVDATEVELAVPGTTDWDRWWVSARELEPPFTPGSGHEAVLDRDAIGPKLTVRGWRSGDRIQPLGMTGSKTLQDLFTDHGVPRSERHRIPVMLAGERIAWVAGIAVAEPFRLRPATRRAVSVTVRPR